MLLSNFVLLASSTVAAAAAVASSSAVNCKNPSIQLALIAWDAVPNHAAAETRCSSILGKYQTTTKTVSSTTGTVTVTSTFLTETTAPTPTATTSTTVTETQSITVDSTVFETATSLTTATVTATAFETTTTTTTSTIYATGRQAPQKRAASQNPVASMVSQLGQLAGGLADTLVTQACACEAPGPTSTSTITSTRFANATSTATLTSFTNTVTPAATTTTLTFFETTSVYETDSITSTTTTTSTVTSTVSTTSTIVATATATVYGSFYIQVTSSDSANGQCAYWEPGQANTFAFAGTGNAPRTPNLWQIDPTTGNLTSAGLIAGDYGGCDYGSCGIIFPRGYPQSTYAAQTQYTAVTCSFNGQDGGVLSCVRQATSAYGNPPTTTSWMYPGLQVQGYPAGNSLNGQETIFLSTSDYKTGVTLTAIFDITKCARNPA